MTPTGVVAPLLPMTTPATTLPPVNDLLAITGLVKRYPSPGGSLPVLDQLDLTVEAGRTIAILGPSGSGKSTLLAIVASLEPATAGSVQLGGTEITTLAGAELAAFRARRIGMVFQDHHLLPQLTAEENVLVPALAAGRVADARARAAELLVALGLDGRQRYFPAQLSGGERQRVAVARALINRPGLLLCDEPTGNLDPRHAGTVVDLLAGLARRDGTTVLMVTHQRELVQDFDRRLELVAGKVRDV